LEKLKTENFFISLKDNFNTQIMKNQFKTFLLLFIVSIFFVSQLQAEVKKKPIIGEWLYEVSDAPYGYEKGSLIFSEKEGQTICVIKLEAGELTVNELKIVKDKVTFTTVVDGSSILVDLTLDKNKLTGKVNTPEGPKNLTAVRK
jgi:hypothetical protein